PYDGTRSLRTGIGSGGVGQGVMGIKPGGRYILTAVAKTGSSADLGGWVGLEFKDSLGNAIARVHANGSSTSWTKYTMPITVPNSFGHATVYVWKNSGPSYLYVDDFSLVESGAALSVSPSSLTFGDQSVGTASGAKFVTITNTGNAALQLGVSTVT